MSIETFPLTEQYILDNVNTLNWTLLCQYQNFSIAFMTRSEVLPKLDWFMVSKHQQLTDAFVNTYAAQLCWRQICLRKNLVSESCLTTNAARLDWGALCSTYSLTETWLRLHKLNLQYLNVSKYQKLSESFMKDLKLKLNFDLLCTAQTMSISFINDMKELINNKIISGTQVLTENFMNSRKDVLDWSLLAKKQVFSETWFKDNHHRFPPNSLSFQCVNFSENVIRQFFDSFNAGSLWQLYPFSEQFLYDFRDSCDFKVISTFQTLSTSFRDYFRLKLDWSALCQCQVFDDTYTNSRLNDIQWSTLSYNYKPTDQNLIDTYILPSGFDQNNWLYLDQSAKESALSGKFTITSNNIECYILTDANNVLQTYNRRFTVALNGTITTVNSYNSLLLTQAPGIVCDTLANVNAIKKPTDKVYRVWSPLDSSVLLSNDQVRSGSITIKQLM